MLGHAEDVERLLAHPGPAEEPSGVVRASASPVHLAGPARLDHQRGPPGGQGRLDLGTRPRPRADDEYHRQRSRTGRTELSHGDGDAGLGLDRVEPGADAFRLTRDWLDWNLMNRV